MTNAIDVILQSPAVVVAEVVEVETEIGIQIPMRRNIMRLEMRRPRVPEDFSGFKKTFKFDYHRFYIKISFVLILVPKIGAV